MRRLLVVIRWILGRLWAGWKKFAFALGTFNRIVLLTLFYFLMVNLVNLIVRLFRIDLLDRKMKPAETYWHERLAETEKNLYRHQF